MHINKQKKDFHFESKIVRFKTNFSAITAFFCNLK